MALTEASPRKPPKALVGHARPRVGPPVPVKHDEAGFRQLATEMGIELMPWQSYASRFLTAKRPDGRALYREIAIVVARQNGKTFLMKPYIIRKLREGKKILHIAQTRELPREMFGLVSQVLAPEEFVKRRGKGGKLQVVWPRAGAGSEEILLANGGWYRIVAASHGGARGRDPDIVIIDECREMETDDVISDAKPALQASDDPQIVYLSNMGTERSVVLNGVRERAGKDESLAYLEWSARPDRSADDREGWLEANPAVGHKPSKMENLVADFRGYSLTGELAIWETENLCRGVTTMSKRIVAETSWLRCQDTLEAPRQVSMAMSMDPSGTRAAAAIAWQQSDGSIGLRLLADVEGSPMIDTDRFATDLKLEARKVGVVKTGFDDWTDKELARHFPKAKPIGGKDFANASENFARLVESGNVRWDVGDSITEQLNHTAPKRHDVGAWSAVGTRHDKPITSVRAAIRAVWLASGPRISEARIY